jgi:hypothetical protein
VSAPTLQQVFEPDAWHAEPVSSKHPSSSAATPATTPPPPAPPVAPDVDALVEEWLTLPDFAEALGVDVLRVRQLVRDQQVPLVRRGERQVLVVPADFVQEGHLVKGLSGLFTLLADGRFEPNESLQWLFTPDDSLPGSPMQALRENRGTEVRRRAQAIAL